MNDLDSRIRRRLADLVADPPMPQDFWDIVSGSGATGTGNSRPSTWRRPMITVAAAVVAVGLVGFVLSGTNPSEQIAAESTQPTPATEMVEGSDNDPGGESIATGDIEAPVSGFPSWFDVGTAQPVLIGAGSTPFEAIKAYFATLGREPALMRLVAPTDPRDFDYLEVLASIHRSGPGEVGRVST